MGATGFFNYFHYIASVTFISIIASANIKLIIILKVGISPNKDHVNKPNVIVANPNPIGLIAQNNQSAHRIIVYYSKKES